MQSKTLSRALPARCTRRLAVAAVLLTLTSSAQAVTINFDDLPAAQTALPGDIVAPGAQLSNQYASYGVLFESLGGFASVVSFGSHAPSTPNAITGSTTGGLISYTVPIYITFVSPANSAVPAVVNWATISGDTLLSGLGTNTLLALDINGNALDFDIQIEPPASTLTVSAPGIHKLVLIGSGTTAFDNLSFDSPVVVPEPATAVLCATAGVALAVCGWRRRKTGAKS